MDIDYLRQKYEGLESDELLRLRKLGDGLEPEARRVLDEILAARSAAVPPTSASAQPRGTAGRDEHIAEWEHRRKWERRNAFWGSLGLVLGALLIAGLADVMVANMFFGGRSPALVKIIVAAAVILPAGQLFAKRRLRSRTLERVGHDGFTELMFRATQGETQRISELLEAGESVNAVDGEGATALMYAAVSNRAVVATLLIKAGADASVRAKSGLTALELARERSFHRVVAALEAQR